MRWPWVSRSLLAAYQEMLAQERGNAAERLKDKDAQIQSQKYRIAALEGEIDLLRHPQHKSAREIMRPLKPVEPSFEEPTSYEAELKAIYENPQQEN